MGLCKYANSLGTPRTGFHAPRLFGMARNDVLGTFALAEISRAFAGGSRLMHVLSWLALGALLHRLFCVDSVL